MAIDIKDLRHASTVESMDEDLASIFIAATMSEKRGNVELFTEEIASLGGFTAQVLQRRLEIMSPNTKISAGVGLVAAVNSEGNPGRAVMWAYTLHKMFKNANRMIDMEDLTQAFPMGFPGRDEFRELWDAQKGGDNLTNNLLDTEEAWL